MRPSEPLQRWYYLRMKKIALWLALLLPLFFSSCGTISTIRPADNLRAGEFEIHAGISGNHFPTIVPVIKGSYGISHVLELGVQTEVYANVAELRFGILRSESHGIALALGIQAGIADFRYELTTTNKLESRTELGVGPVLVVGRRWDYFELYLGARALINIQHTDLYSGVHSVKLGSRFRLGGPMFFGIEAGPACYVSYTVPLWAAEGAIVGGLRM